MHTENRAPSPLTKLTENALSSIFSLIRLNYLLILGLREALFDHVYQAEELGHLSCLLRYSDFHLIQVLFSSMNTKLDSFVRSYNLVIDITTIKGNERTQKYFGTWKLADSSSYHEVLTQLVFNMIPVNIHVNYSLWRKKKGGNFSNTDSIYWIWKILHKFLMILY